MCQFTSIDKSWVQEQWAQAKSIIEDAILKGDNVVFDLLQYDSLKDMVNEALNFESYWPKTPGDDSKSLD